MARVSTSRRPSELRGRGLVGLVLVGVSATACTPGPARDVDLYLEARALVDTDPEQALARCREIGDLQLAGECAQVVALAVPKGQGGPETWCPEVPSTSWTQPSYMARAA